MAAWNNKASEIDPESIRPACCFAPGWEETL